MFGKKKIQLKNKNHNQAFALVELLVSLSLIILVTSMVLARNNAFDSAVLLRNQAYEVAFAIREAQQLAVSGEGDTNEIQQYGVYFDNSALLNRQLIIFRDEGSTPDGRYTSGETVISTIRLDRRFNISNLTGGNNLSIVFRRPFYDARFKNDNISNSGPVTITINKTNSSNNRLITVTTAGQISVN